MKRVHAVIKFLSSVVRVRRVQEVLFVLVNIFLIGCGDIENNPSPQSSEITPSAMNLHPDDYNVLKVGPHRTAYLPAKILKTLILEVA